MKEADDLFTEGMKMLAMIGFIMIANGFAEVMRETGEIKSLVEGSVAAIGENKALAALLMLVVGLLITMGIGSSFSTIPIIAALYVPLALQLGFSPWPSFPSAPPVPWVMRVHPPLIRPLGPLPA